MRIVLFLFGCVFSWVLFAQQNSTDPKQIYTTASELFGKQQFLEAAQTFEGGYEQFKDHATYGPAFLYNAAIAYQQYDTITAPNLEAAKKAYKLFSELLLSYPQIPTNKQDIAKQKIAELLLKWPEIVARATDCAPNKYPFCPIPSLPPKTADPLKFCVEKKILCRAAIGAAASISVAGSLYGFRIVQPKDALTEKK